MEESDWLGCDDPDKMLRFLRDRGKLSERKARLFGVACCRRVLDPLDDERCLGGITVAESFADGQGDAQELRRARDSIHTLLDEYPDAYDAASEAVYTAYFALSLDIRTPATLGHLLEHGAASAALAAEDSPEADAYVEAWMRHQGKDRQNRADWAPAAYQAYQEESRQQAHGEQCTLLRDLFGPLLFRPITLPPSVAMWNSGTVVRLAQAAYQERELPSGHLDLALLRVLADALEEAGVTDPDTLGHLRGPGPHTRGCWVVDLLTGRD